MRLDGARGDRGWRVWHVERCESVPWVRWVDDETNEYAQFVRPIRLVLGELPLIVRKAKRILIVPNQRLVLINPIEDSDTESLQTEDFSYG